MARLIDKDEKKRHIAIAAIDLFAEHGVAKTSVEAIAKAAEVGKGTVYLYFNTKEEIIVEIWAHVQEILDADMGRRFEEACSYEEKIRIFFDFSSLHHQAGLVEKLTKIYTMYLSIVLLGENKTLRQDFKEHILNDGLTIKALLDEGVKAGEFKAVNTLQIARTLYLVKEGILILGLAMDLSIATMRERLDEQLEYILSTIRKDRR